MKRKKILCIDDDRDVLIFLKTVIEKNDFAFFQASTAKEGLVLFNEVEPDFVIVDLMMESVDAGVKFTSDIRHINYEVPIYVLSSVGNDLYTSINTSYFGITGVFQKPVKPAVLLKVLNETFSDTR